MSYEDPNLRKEKFTELELLVKEVIFKGREEIKIPIDGKYTIKNSKFSVKVFKYDEKEPDFFELILTRNDGAETAWMLDEESNLLRGDWRDYKIIDEQVKIIKSAAEIIIKQ